MELLSHISNDEKDRFQTLPSRLQKTEKNLLELAFFHIQ